MDEIKRFESMDMSFDLIPKSINGIVLYFTPKKFRNKNIFLLQLVNGLPILIFDHGNSEHQVSINCTMDPDVKTSILISLQRNMIQMIINNNENCRNYTTFHENSTYYNFNFVFQYDSVLPNIHSIAKRFNWTSKPQINFINGTIHDLKNTIFYNQVIPQEPKQFESNQMNASFWATGNNKFISIVLTVSVTTVVIIIILILIKHKRRNNVMTYVLLKT